MTLLGLLLAATVFTVVLAATFAHLADQSKANAALLQKSLGGDESSSGSGTAPTTVGGTVTSSTGAPVSGVAIVLFGSATGPSVTVAQTVTDDNGGYQLANVKAGTYRVKFGGAGFTDVWYPDAPTFDEGADVVVEEKPLTLDAQLVGQPASIAGKVTGEDLLGATVVVRIPADTLPDLPDAPSTTAAADGSSAAAGTGPVVQTVAVDSAGAYTISGLPTPNTYELLATKPGYVSRPRTVKVAPGDELTDIVLDLLKGDGNISGTVVDATGQPITGAEVLASDGTNATSTVTLSADASGAEAGTFELQNLITPGTFSLSVRHDGFLTTSVTVRLDAGVSSPPQTIVLRPSAGSVGGTVNATGPGAGPLGGVTVTVSGPEFSRATTSLTTDPVGSWQLTGVPLPGTYTVTFSAGGFSTQAIGVELSPAVPQNLTLERDAHTGDVERHRSGGRGEQRRGHRRGDGVAHRPGSDAHGAHGQLPGRLVRLRQPAARRVHHHVPTHRLARPHAGHHAAAGGQPTARRGDRAPLGDLRPGAGQRTAVRRRGAAHLPAPDRRPAVPVRPADRDGAHRRRRQLRRAGHSRRPVHRRRVHQRPDPAAVAACGGQPGPTHAEHRLRHQHRATDVGGGADRGCAHVDPDLDDTTQHATELPAGHDAARVDTDGDDACAQPPGIGRMTTTLHVELHTTELVLAPAQPASVGVRVRNTGGEPLVLTLRIAGLDTAGGAPGASLGTLAPGAALTTTVHFALPAETAAGDRLVAVQVLGSPPAGRPGQPIEPVSATAHLRLRVGSTSRLALRLARAEVDGRRRGKLVADLHNQGTEQLDLRLWGEGADVTVAFERAELTLPAGHSTRVRGTVRTGGFTWRRAERRAFVVTAQGNTTPATTAGSYVQKGLLPGAAHHGIGRPARAGAVGHRSGVAEQPVALAGHRARVGRQQRGRHRHPDRRIGQ